MAQRSFKLPDELDARLAAKARKLDRPVSWVIVRAIEHALYGDCSTLSTREQRDASMRGILGNSPRTEEGE